MLLFFFVFVFFVVFFVVFCCFFVFVFVFVFIFCFCFFCFIFCFILFYFILLLLLFFFFWGGGGSSAVSEYRKYALSMDLLKIEKKTFFVHFIILLSSRYPPPPHTHTLTHKSQNQHASSPFALYYTGKLCPESRNFLLLYWTTRSLLYETNEVKRSQRVGKNSPITITDTAKKKKNQHPPPLKSIQYHMVT